MDVTDPPLRLGVSRCLLGEEVRWDGGHKRDAFLVRTVGPFVEWVDVCPEQEVGMGIPREPVRLTVEDAKAPARMVGRKSGEDWTTRMNRHARSQVRALGKQDLDGFVLKRGSPSCGMERVKHYGPKGHPLRMGSGLFAAELLERYPLLPIEEEGRLNDPVLRENFFVRAFGYRRLRAAFSPRWTLGGLVAFHTAEKLLLRTHDLAAYRRMGRLVAEGKSMPRAELAAEYQREYMTALTRRATRRRHVDTLQHMQGHLKKLISAEAKRELLGVIEDFRSGLVPLVVPLTLLRHHVRMHQVEYLQGQVYLEPAPKELMLRNHV